MPFCAVAPWLVTALAIFEPAVIGSEPPKVPATMSSEPWLKSVVTSKPAIVLRLGRSEKLTGKVTTGRYVIDLQARHVAGFPSKVKCGSGMQLWIGRNCRAFGRSCRPAFA